MSVVHKNFCRATAAHAAMFLMVFLSACGGQKSKNPNAIPAASEDGTMVDTGVGPLSFKPIKKGGSQADKDDKLQAFIRNSGEKIDRNGKIFATRGNKEPAAKGSTEAPMWSILLKTLNASESRSADQFLSVIASDVPGAVMQRREAGTAIVVGAFESPESAAAQSELKRIRNLEIKGLRPYQSAMLVPPEVNVQSAGSFDLRTIGETIGPKDSKYTLEVAVYGKPDRSTPNADELKKFRTSAEEAVKQLRKDGEDAYYLHTQRQSIVTVGVFGSKEVDGEESANVQAARAKHPHVLLNGEGVKIRGKGADAVLQKTHVVEIPKK